MKKIIFLIFVLLLLLFLFFGSSNSISAQTIKEDYFLIQINLFSDGSALVVGSSNINPDIEEISYENQTIYGISQYLTNKQKEKWNFNLNLEKVFSEIYVKVILPENAKLNSIDSNLISFISTEENMIIIEFIDTNKNLIIKFDYELNSTSISEAKNYKIYFLIILIIVAIIIIILWWFFLRKKFKKKKKKENLLRKTKIKKKKNNLQEKLKAIRQTLNERENKIIKELIEHKKLKQSQLQHLTKIPKVSLSRYLVSLENKNLIIKKSLGKTNIIEINKNFGE